MDSGTLEREVDSASSEESVFGTHMAYPGGAFTNDEKTGITATKQAVKYVVDEAADAKSICQSIDENLSSSGTATSSSKMDLPLLAERQGDVISSHKALLTLAKGFVGTGCLSLPFAWRQGGLWVSFVLQIVISGLNWYSNHILAKSAQYLAARSARPSLDYGHFAKKVFDFSGSEFLKQHSRKSMYVVNVTVLLYQLGCSSVPIVFVATNLNKLFSHYLDVQLSNALYATAILLPLILVNMVATMKVLSYLAMTATFLWLFGALTMLQQCFRLPSQWSSLPAYTDFWSTIMFFGTAMYSYEGQTMILPIENKMRYPEDFTENCGVLPTLMVLITVFYTSLGFYGYTAFGEATKGTLPLNMPDNTLFSSVSIMLAMMAFLAHPVNLYVVFDMFWPGFKRKFPLRYVFWLDKIQTLDILFRLFWVLLTYFIAVFVPRIEQIISLVGITSGSLCAFVYPPILEILTFSGLWHTKCSRKFILFKIVFNFMLIFLGMFLCVFGFYVNVSDMYTTIKS